MRAAFIVVTRGRKPPVASAKPATAPRRRRRPGRGHRRGDPGRTDRDRDVAGPRGRARARRPCCRRCRRASSAAAGARPTASRARRRAGARRPPAERRLEQVGQPGAVARRPVAGAGGVAAVGGRLGAGARRGARSSVVVREQHAARPARRASGSWSRSQRSLVTVNDATRTLPDQLGTGLGAAQLRRPARPRRSPSGCRSTAARRAPARRRRRGRPCRAAGRRRRPRRPGRAGPPCASSSAPSQARGSTSVPAGWAARRSSATTLPSSASTRTALDDCVEESIPRTNGTTPYLYDS